MKRAFAVFAAFAFLTGCGGSDEGPRLDQFAGTWKASYTIRDAQGARASSGTLKVTQPTVDAVLFAESSTIVTGVSSFGVPSMQTKSFEVRLKRSSNAYLLSVKVDGDTILMDLPLSVSGDGLHGQKTVTLAGKEQPITASITRQGAGSVWKIASDEASTPRRIYEFEFKERTAA